MLTIVAGPCSIDKKNICEVEEILSIKINNKKIIAGTRAVGLKSRTEYSQNNHGMGIDFENFNYNMQILINGGSINDFIDLPSILLAKKLQEKFNCIIATEIMEPAIQMPLLEKHLKGMVLPWNPAVNQLGWPIKYMSEYCEKNNWFLGFKNPKNLGITVENSEKNNIISSMERVWKGLTTFSNLQNNKKILIHRGVDSEIKSNFRNEPVHKTAIRTKLSIPNIKLFFDPSHCYGEKLKDKIVEGTIEAMQLKDLNNNYLYNGILIEVGTSETDTKQHITINELIILVKELNKFREF